MAIGEDRDPPPRLGRLLGPAPLSSGVVHVVAVCEVRGALRVLRIGPKSPKSENDFFLLNAARARAEAIVTTGAILRAEPGVRWSLQGEPSVRRELADWRRRLGLDDPWVALLTSGRDLDLGHPGLHAGVAPIVMTGAAGARRVARSAAGLGIEVVVLEEPGLLSTLAELRARGIGRITVEAGPSTASALYGGTPPEVDELWLSTFLAEPAPGVVGAALLERSDLTSRLRAVSAPVEVEEPSGRWRFQRFRPGG